MSPLTAKVLVCSVYTSQVFQHFLFPVYVIFCLGERLRAFLGHCSSRLPPPVYLNCLLRKAIFWWETFLSIFSGNGTLRVIVTASGIKL